MKKLKYIIMISAAVLFLLVPRAFAGSNARTMLVSAKVLPFVSGTLMHQAGEVTITAGDIKRGYIDVKRGTVLEVRTNSKNGYLLSFERENGPYKEVWVIDKARTTVLSGSGGLIHQPYSASSCASSSRRTV